jgi:hypothetical protein
LDDQLLQLQLDCRPVGIAAVFGSIELLRNELPVSSQNWSGLGNQATCANALLPSRLPISARVDRQVFVLEEQFLIDQTRDMRQQHAQGFSFHIEGP